MDAKTTSKSIKKRVWAFVCYPESLPLNWLDLLRQSGIQSAISPLHQFDIENEETGETKKAHYHVLLVFDGPTTYNNVATFVKQFNGTIPKAIESVRGMYRYHIHLDDPNKYQYNDKDRILLNGFDYSQFVELTKSEVLRYKKKIIEIIIENVFLEYYSLVDFACKCEDSNIFDIVCSNTLFFNTYLKSRRFGV